MPVRDLLALAPGAIVELDGSPANRSTLLVNGVRIARGEVSWSTRSSASA